MFYCWANEKLKHNLISVYLLQYPSGLKHFWGAQKIPAWRKTLHGCLLMTDPVKAKTFPFTTAVFLCFRLLSEREHADILNQGGKLSRNETC